MFPLFYVDLRNPFAQTSPHKSIVQMWNGECWNILIRILCPCLLIHWLTLNGIILIRQNLLISSRCSTRNALKNNKCFVTPHPFWVIVETSANMQPLNPGRRFLKNSNNNKSNKITKQQKNTQHQRYPNQPTDNWTKGVPRMKNWSNYCCSSSSFTLSWCVCVCTWLLLLFG